MIKAALIDFDGTIVNQDILDLLCGLNNKQDESAELNTQFHQGKLNGITGLVPRINLLKGLSIDQISNKISENFFLMPGAEEFFAFLKNKGIVSILHSGNIIPVLNIYKEKLGIDYVVGSDPYIEDNRIKGISENDFPQGSFKLAGIQKILESLNIPREECIAIGDSPADIPIFEFSLYSISINPKNGVEKNTNISIQNDLRGAITFIEDIQ